MYLLWPFLALAAAAAAWRRTPIPRRMIPLALVVGCWCLYVAGVGGDFMEFRFLVPVAPFLFLIVAYSIHDVIGVAWLRRPEPVAVVSAIVLLATSIVHGATALGVYRDRTLDSIPALASFYDVYPDHDWTRIGRALKDELGDLGPAIAIHAVGAIPYYSGLRTVDQYGLNDSNVAARGLPAPREHLRPGHQRMFPVSYLREQGVNFVLGHPTLIPRGSLPSPETEPILADWLRGIRGFDPSLPGRVTVVAMPVDGRMALLMWELTPTPALDRRIREHKWEAAEVSLAF